MDETPITNRDANMRRTGSPRAEKEQVARMNGRLIDPASQARLLSHLPWQADAVPSQYILDKAAAVETGRITAAGSIRCSSQGERSPGDSGPVRS